MKQRNISDKTDKKNSGPDNPQICFISARKPTFSWDGKPIYTIKDITVYDNTPPASRYLDEPLFTQVEGRISLANNPLINTYDCNPDFLLALTERIANGDMPYPEAIRTKVISNIRNVFLNNTTPRTFYEDIRKYANVLFKDNQEPETYRIDPNLYFQNMAKGRILAFDIHDLLHHPLQLAAWPDQFKYIALTAYLVRELPIKEQKTKRLRKLTLLCWLACFEESLITMEDQLVSFGCLNWLSPSETPLNKQPSIRTLSIDDQKIGFRWHYIDTIKELYKVSMASNKLVGIDLKWMEKLGYDVDPSLKKLIESDNPRPFENLEYYDALKFKVQTPKSPEELFKNAINLIQEEL